MLPLECPYLNKTALFTVVGQQVSSLNDSARDQTISSAVPIFFSQYL